MISVNDIKDFANRAWNRGDVLRGAALSDPEFPLRLRFKKAGGQHVIDSFAEIQRWVSELNASSKDKRGFGYAVEFSQVNHRKLGRQNLPSDIRFDSPYDLARFIGKQNDLDEYLTVLRYSEEQNPSVAAWMKSNPMKVLPHMQDWEKVLRVCDYLLANPRPGIYLRQLALPGIDTKFFEGKRAILSEALTQCLPREAYEDCVTGLSRAGFERRYGFLYDEPFVRFRILDDSILPDSDYRDVSVPATDFARTPIPGVQTVFITENKVNGLAFPMVKGSIVVFGLGYGIGELAEAEWLKDKRVVYWGDIDTHGYGILSMLRGKLPHVESILMNCRDLDQNKNLAVQESSDTRRTDSLTNLTDAELAAYQRLFPGGDCEGTRIEQERVPYMQLISALRLDDRKR
ncbi:DUF3322 domain-containing protein [Geoalkalibacter halelectricus]|uniref:DUF3322 domain-containing protein n=1 Tax=Geoalkalibacter halelectricus TaxID=2847045 RepID=A0ABY5ZRL9_9BACT|nr:DUF3322 domain-containing protein [Geoalkalibacter halelectricus]MDO3377701.1 DUF3322 domain-containing protein [Geoalkalibacter halelectricus]UWZ81489.1 DUF3322 domain-containing protein [Geoalkalibacter halelectricus]